MASAVLERSLAGELSILSVDHDLIWHRDGDVTVVYRLHAFHEPSLDDDAMNAAALLAENAWSGLPEGTRYQFFVLLDQHQARRMLTKALPPIVDDGGAAGFLEELRRSRLEDLLACDESVVAQDRRHYLAATFRPTSLRRRRLVPLVASLRTMAGRFAGQPRVAREAALEHEVLQEAAHFERRVFRSLSTQEGLELHRCRGIEMAAVAHELLSPTAASHSPALSVTTPLLEDDIVVERTRLRVGDRFVAILSMKDLPDRTEPGLLVPLLRLNRGRYRLVYSVDIPERAEELSLLRRKAALAEGLRHTAMVETARTDPHADAVSAQSNEAMRKMFSSTQRLFGTSLQLVLMEDSVETLEEAVQEGLAAMAATQGMRGYRETFLLRRLFLSHAPGAPPVLERRRKALTPVMVDLQPVFDFRSGDSTRGVPFLTRDRAAIFFDPFDPRAQMNANILVTGTSGAGKSVAVQMIVSGYELMAACHGHPAPRVFIIDNGASYKRFMDARPHDGRYIPFSFNEPPGCDILAFDPAVDDREEHVSRLQWLLVDLLRLDPAKDGDFGEKNAVIERALLDLYAEGSDGGTRTFAELSRHLGDSPASRAVGDRLRSFVDGKFARMFAANDRLAVGDDVHAVCYDFGRLAEHPDLALIALRLVIYEIRRAAARRHRASGRQGRSFLVLDESWALLDAGTGGALTTMAAPFIAASVRMGRKEGLSTIALSQQIEDFARSGYGAAILGNCATKLVGRPGKEAVAAIEKHLQLSPRQAEQVRRLACNDRFHEFLLTQADISNVVRITLDPLSRWLFTSSPQDRERIAALQASRPDLDLLATLRVLAAETRELA